VRDSNIRIRDATAADLPAIVDIYNSTIPSRMVTADLEPVSVASREAWFADHSPERWPLWMAERDNRLIGWLSFSRFHPRAAYAVTGELSIYIHENHRGRGLGKILLERAITHAPEIGLKSLVGLIFAHNRPSVGLFAQFGFTEWGNLPQVCVLDGVARDVVILGRHVGAMT
jgi:L-amino acid N-acyltransferase YncA